MNKEFSIAIHGGAGTILKSQLTKEKEKQLQETLMLSIRSGISILQAGGSAIDAVVTSVTELENSSLFNAGKGSVFNSDGFIEMDAAVMCGNTLNAGAVTCVRNIKNPVQLAHLVFEHSQHVLLSGSGAEKFAKANGANFKKDDYFFTNFRFDQLVKAKKSREVHLDHNEGKEGKFGTVGAVARDRMGNLASATSTGGMTNQHAGRIGDTPLLGSGTYANNSTCAVSCTGIGEAFIRAVAAYDVSALMGYKNIGLKEASEIVIFEKLARFEGEGGLISVDKSGNLELPFNSRGMYRAWCQCESDIHLAFYENEFGTCSL